MDTLASAPVFAALDWLGLPASALPRIDACWSEAHRFFHTPAHCRAVIARALASTTAPEDRHALVAAALFHDAVYDPRAADNEERSVELLRACVAGTRCDAARLQVVCGIIEDTGTLTPRTDLARAFLRADLSVLAGSFQDLLVYEAAIFKEFQHLDYAVYGPGRAALLRRFAAELPAQGLLDPVPGALESLAVWVEARRPRVAIYAGSFNPFHRGHLNIVQKAERVFDKVIIAVGDNPLKTNETREDPAALASLRHRQVEHYAGLTTDYLREKSEHVEATLVRGLRNGADLDYEVNQLRMMQDIVSGDVDVVFIPCDRELEHISSTATRLVDAVAPAVSAAKYRAA